MAGLIKKFVLIWMACATICAIFEMPAFAEQLHSQRKPIRFAYQNRIGSAIPIIAVEMNLFAKEGLVVVPFRFNSGPACSEALFTGAADIGTMGDATAVIAIAKAAPVRIIASHAAGGHRHRLIVRKASSIRSIGELPGKRIGVKKGTSTYGGLLTFLDVNNIPRNRIEIVDLSPSNMPEALQAGAIDLFAASEPTPSLAELRGGRELTTLGGLGNAYPIMLVANSKFLDRRPEDLCRFVSALRAAEALVQKRSPEVVSKITDVTGLPPEIAVRAMDRHIYRLQLDNDTIRSLKDTALFLLDQGRIEKVPDVSRAVVQTFVQNE